MVHYLNSLRRIMNLGGDEMKQAKAKLEEQFFPAIKWGSG